MALTLKENDRLIIDMQLEDQNKAVLYQTLDQPKITDFEEPHDVSSWRGKGRDSLVNSQSQRHLLGSENSKSMKNSEIDSAYKSMMGHEVKGKIRDMYRMESTAQSLSNKKKILRQKIKTIMFFIMDVLVCAVCLVAFSEKYDAWKKCYYDFDLWIFTLNLFGVLSLIVDIASFLLLNSI